MDLGLSLAIFFSRYANSFLQTLRSLISIYVLEFGVSAVLLKENLSFKAFVFLKLLLYPALIIQNIDR